MNNDKRISKVLGNTIMESRIDKENAIGASVKLSITYISGVVEMIVHQKLVYYYISFRNNTMIYPKKDIQTHENGNNSPVNNCVR